jgi:hypothetical protein
MSVAEVSVGCDKVGDECGKVGKWVCPKNGISVAK